MSMHDEIVAKADKLIEKGGRVLATSRAPGPNVLGPSHVDTALFHEWRSQVLMLVDRTLGKGSTYFDALKGVGSGTRTGDAKATLGILRGFREDVQDGGLERIEDLVSADVFDDLLDQAAQLLKESYVMPAAGLAGAVLERELRSICERRSIKYKRSDGLAALNSKLVSDKAYSAILSKKIGLWAKIRNDADHGHFDHLTAEDVDAMLKGVRDFVEDQTS